MIRSAAVLCVFASTLAAFPVPKPARTPSIAGTWSGPITWNPNAMQMVQTFTFETGGRVTMSYGNRSSTIYTGTWQEDSVAVTWKFPESSSSYTATLEGDNIIGTAHNDRGMTANFTSTRVNAK